MDAMASKALCIAVCLNIISPCFLAEFLRSINRHCDIHPALAFELSTKDKKLYWKEAADVPKAAARMEMRLYCECGMKHADGCSIDAPSL